MILAKKIDVLLRYITNSAGLAAMYYYSTISKDTGMITKIKWNDAMKKCANDKEVVVHTINDYTENQLENPEWIIHTFIAWADRTANLTIADFQSESLNIQKGNLGEELIGSNFLNSTYITNLQSRQEFEGLGLVWIELLIKIYEKRLYLGKGGLILVFPSWHKGSQGSDS